MAHHGGARSAWLLVAGLSLWLPSAPPAGAQDTPAGPAVAEEEPPLEGEAKALYEKAMQGFTARLQKIKARDDLLALLSDLESDGSRAARDFLVKYARTVKSAEYRARAFEALAKIGGTTAVAFLCGKSGARASDALVQRQAVEALAKAGDARAVDPLLGLLADAAVKIETRAAVCLALGRLAPGDERVGPAIQKAAQDKRDTVRVGAVEALGWLPGEKPLSDLLAVLKGDRNASIRAAAARGLGHNGGEKAVEALRAALAADKSDEVREAATKALEPGGGR